MTAHEYRLSFQRHVAGVLHSLQPVSFAVHLISVRRFSERSTRCSGTPAQCDRVHRPT